MNSLSMLKAVGAKLAQRGFRLVNLDSVILAEAPRMGPYLAEMEIRMAEIFGGKNLSVDPISCFTHPSSERRSFILRRRLIQKQKVGLGGCPRLVIVTRLCRFESDFSIV